MKIYAAVMDSVPDAITLKANPGGVGVSLTLPMERSNGPIAAAANRALQGSQPQWLLVSRPTAARGDQAAGSSC